MLLSIVIPAFNEGAYLNETLANLNRARALLRSETGEAAEVIVVDNGSDDSTAAVARDRGATVVEEAVHSIAKVRNTGAKASHGDVIVFVDADTTVPEHLLLRISEAMSDKTCLSGS